MDNSLPSALLQPHHDHEDESLLDSEGDAIMSHHHDEGRQMTPKAAPRALLHWRQNQKASTGTRIHNLPLPSNKKTTTTHKNCCPHCGEIFSENTSPIQKELHVKLCGGSTDDKNSSLDPQNPFISFQLGSSSLLPSTKLAKCPLCNQDLQILTSFRREQHLKQCQESFKESFECAICGQVFEEKKLKSQHQRTCAKMHGVKSAQLNKTNPTTKSSKFTSLSEGISTNGADKSRRRKRKKDFSTSEAHSNPNDAKQQQTRKKRRLRIVNKQKDTSACDSTENDLTDSQRSVDSMLDSYTYQGGSSTTSNTSAHQPLESLTSISSRETSLIPASVSDWLKQAGLSSYLTNFLENGYDTLDVCASLEEDDFSSDGLNITKKGHRKKMMMETKKLAELLKDQKSELPSSNTVIATAVHGGHSTSTASSHYFRSAFSVSSSTRSSPSASSSDKKPEEQPKKKRKKFVIRSSTSQGATPSPSLSTTNSSSTHHSTTITTKNDSSSPNSPATTLKKGTNKSKGSVSAKKKKSKSRKSTLGKTKSTADDTLSGDKTSESSGTGTGNTQQVGKTDDGSNRSQQENDISKYAPICDTSSRKSPLEMEKLIMECEIGDLDAVEERPLTQELITSGTHPSRSSSKANTKRSPFTLSRLTPSQTWKRTISLTPPEEISVELNFDTPKHSSTTGPRSVVSTAKGRPVLPPQTKRVVLKPAVIDLCDTPRTVIDDDNTSEENNGTTNTSSIQQTPVVLKGNDKTPVASKTTETTHEGALEDDEDYQLCNEHLVGMTPCVNKAKKTDASAQKPISRTIVDDDGQDSSNMEVESTEHNRNDLKLQSDTVKQVESSAVEESAPHCSVDEMVDEDCNDISHTGKEDHSSSPPPVQSSSECNDDEAQQKVEDIQRKYTAECNSLVREFESQVRKMYNELCTSVNNATNTRDDAMDDVLFLHEAESFEVPPLESIFASSVMDPNNSKLDQSSYSSTTTPEGETLPSDPVLNEPLEQNEPQPLTESSILQTAQRVTPSSGVRKALTEDSTFRTPVLRCGAVRKRITASEVSHLDKVSLNNNRMSSSSNDDQTGAANLHHAESAEVDGGNHNTPVSISDTSSLFTPYQCVPSPGSDILFTNGTEEGSYVETPQYARGRNPRHRDVIPSSDVKQAGSGGSGQVEKRFERDPSPSLEHSKAKALQSDFLLDNPFFHSNGMRRKDDA